MITPMSIYFSIQYDSAAEYDALDSEGAPWMNMSNGNGILFQQNVLCIESDYCGILDPDEIIAGADTLMLRAGNLDLLDFRNSPSGYWYSKTQALIEIARAAKALDRKIVFS
jgi:hypothetical protein